MKNGFLKVCTLSPALRVADCAYNTQETIAAMQQAAQDGAAQAHLLFDCLRRLDELGARQVYAHAPAPKGVGLAVYNRLIRAAAFEMIDLP